MKDVIRTNLANVVSAIALLFTWLAIVFLLEDKFFFSFGLILLALVFDALDGYLARKLSIDNLFGRAIDGYVDVINYLVYPALVFLLYFKFTNFFSVISIFVFLAAGIIRLARFEIRGIKKIQGMLYYEGLPVFISPVIIIIFLALNPIMNSLLFFWFFIFILFIVSALMVQTFKFPKPKNILPVLLLILVLACVFLFKGS